MINTADFLIEKLKLIPHSEGGYFNETYRSSEKLSANSLPERYKKEHSYSTCIYFLLKGYQISKFHRIKSDEIWHFYEGCPIIIYNISENGELIKINLGNSIEEGQTFQAIMPKNTWFAAELADKDSYGLVGCTVAPSFEYEDFELARQEDLLKSFPKIKDLIIKFTQDQIMK